MTDKLHCPYCNDVLVFDEVSGNIGHKNSQKCDCPHYKHLAHPAIWQALIDAQDALNKISDIKESVEGCCAEIQQKCLPFLFSIDRDMKLKIDKEVSAIDTYMSDIEEIIALKHGGLPLLQCKACNHLPNPPIKICSK